MNEQGAMLCGIDGDLRGEESSLQGRLPFLRLRDEIYAARSADWSLTDDSLQLLSALDAQERGTLLSFAAHVPVLPGQLAVVSGPAFARWCSLLELPLPGAQAK